MKQPMDDKLEAKLTMGITLAELVRGLDVDAVYGDLRVPVPALCYDSRKVVPGAAFVAVRGAILDGHQFIGQALERGAAAIISEQAPQAVPGVIFLQVPDSRKALAQLAVNYFGHPTRTLQLIGVTGTNGKTTTTLLLESIFCHAQRRVGVIGTLGYRWADKRVAASMTTPESLDLQRLFHAMRQDQVTHAIMEVSSHALALGRVAGCQFNAAVFTNLSQDHLDFHGNLDDYFAAKSLLFSDHLEEDGSSGPAVAVINLDDARAEQLTSSSKGEVWSYALRHGRAQVRVRRAEFAAGGIRADVITPRGTLELRSRLLGRLNLYNLLAAASTALALDVPEETIVTGLEAVTSVDGRLQRVATGRGFEVVVDYAHTPDAMEKSLECLRELTRERLLVVFGCGGDRDRSKRPLMGKVAASFGDIVVLTSDNPRSEDPAAIIRDIEPGLQEAGANRLRNGSRPQADAGRWYTVQPDRRRAIALALSWARPGDLVFIGGKGHETYQIVGKEVFPFDDRAVVLESLAGPK
jgi:UDP-N-acetylmuramoyl-L-alanyl-D-glutamate--2,6-diaminopimelate ligase